MIIKGKSRAEPMKLALHLENAETNERVELLETRHTIGDDLRTALVEMYAHAAGTKCTKPLYHAAISPAQTITREQINEAVDALEQKLGFDDQARVIVLHEKHGRQHIHVVWSRIDLETMTAVHDGHNYRKHEEVARDLERKFGHERVQGAHHEREGIARPDRTPSRAELRQEERTGIRGKKVKEEVTAIFRSSDTPQAFEAALAEHGYMLARGDRRDFVIVDQGGGTHSLARRIDGVKAAELRAFMAPLDPATLLSADEAKEAQISRVATLGTADGALEAAKLAQKYARGQGYVSQSTTALKDHKERQAALNAVFEREQQLQKTSPKGQTDPDIQTSHNLDEGPGPKM